MPITNNQRARLHVAAAAAFLAGSLLALTDTATGASSGHAIIALVNDEPITAYEVEQRGRLLALNANVGDYIKNNIKTRWAKGNLIIFAPSAKPRSWWPRQIPRIGI